jgi:hypothetical protein
MTKNSQKIKCLRNTEKIIFSSLSFIKIILKIVSDLGSAEAKPKIIT